MLQKLGVVIRLWTKHPPANFTTFYWAKSLDPIMEFEKKFEIKKVFFNHYFKFLNIKSYNPTYTLNTVYYFILNPQTDVVPAPVTNALLNLDSHILLLIII